MTTVSPPMSGNEYQIRAIRTMNEQTDLTNVALGLAGEAGEFADAIKKHLYHGHPLDETHLRKELGDILWYVAVGGKLLNARLSDVMAENIEKLARRYPEGFSYEASKNRAEYKEPLVGDAGSDITNVPAAPELPALSVVVDDDQFAAGDYARHLAQQQQSQQLPADVHRYALDIDAKFRSYNAGNTLWVDVYSVEGDINNALAPEVCEALDEIYAPSADSAQPSYTSPHVEEPYLAPAVVLDWDHATSGFVVTDIRPRTEVTVRDDGTYYTVMRTTYRADGGTEGETTTVPKCPYPQIGGRTSRPYTAIRRFFRRLFGISE